MDRQQFFKELKFALRRHEYADVEAVIDYYEEIIMERKERGEREEDIIASFDPIEKIAANVERELGKAEKKKNVEVIARKAVEEPGPKNFGKAAIVTCTLPITLPLMIMMFLAVFLLVLGTMIAVMSLWVACVALVGSGVAVIVVGTIAGIAAGSWMAVFGLIAAGLLVFALGLWMINLSAMLTKGIFKISAKALKGIVRLFTRKRKVKQEQQQSQQ